MSGSSSPTAVAVDHQQELDLLHRGPDLSSMTRALASAPIVTYGAMRAIGEPSTRALLGRELGMPSTPDNDTRVYINSAAAWTGIVLGQQGSGRSHTTACILESCTLRDSRIGKLDQPMATLVCYYDDADSGQPCKSVSLAAGDVADPLKITVLVSPRRLKHMRKVYAGLDRVSVLPLSLRSSDVSPSVLLQVFDDASPRLRRLMRTKLLQSVDAINYSSIFKEVGPSLSDSEKEEFLACTEFLEDLIQEDSPSISFHFETGRVVILDVSDPFIQPISAGNLFSVVTHAFSCWKHTRDKIALLDNVHAYLPYSPVLRDSIAHIAKRTRRQNMRLLLTAQEPTVFTSDLLDTSSFVLCHKLGSPPLSDYLSRLVDDASRSDTGGHQEAQWRRQLIELFPGEAVLFSSGALVLDAEETPALLGSGQLTLCIRERITGGDTTSNSLATPRSSQSQSSATTSATSSKHNSPPTTKPTLPSVPEVLSSSSQIDQTTSTFPASFTSSFASASPLPPPQAQTSSLFMPQPSRVLPKPEFSVPPAATPTAQIPAATPAPAAAATNQIPTPTPAAVRQSAPPLRNAPSAEKQSRKPPPSTTTTSTSTSTSTSASSGAHAFWQPPSSARNESSRPPRHKVTVEELEEEFSTHAAPALAGNAGHILEPVTNGGEPRSETSHIVPQLQPQAQPQPPPQPRPQSQAQPTQPQAQAQSYPQPYPPKPQPQPQSQPQAPAPSQLQSQAPPSSHPRSQPQHHVHASTRQRVSSSASQQYASMQMQPPNAPKRPTSPVISVRSMSIAPPKRFAELLSVMDAFAQRGETRPSKTDVAAAVGEGFIGTGFVTFRGYTLAAEKAGLIRRGGSPGGSEWMELVE